MKLLNVDFTTWCNNHVANHDDKWCRELYPYSVFRKIDFSDQFINVQQKIEFNRIDYFVTILKIELQESNRYRATFDLSTLPASKTQAWKKRVWKTRFQIIYSLSGNFITVFTKNEDPSKDFVVRFMKGRFEKLELNKSIPVSELLLKTLLLHISEENYPGGTHYQTFIFLENGVRTLALPPEFKRFKLDFSPIYSIDRELWICYAFTEEKAHRVAFYNANQCERIVVVYCNPSYTRHQRCKYPETEIVSIYEFANFVSSTLRAKYEPQIKFLQNHLNIVSQYTIQDTEKQIMQPVLEWHEIDKSDLMEALGVMKIIPTTKLETFYSLAALNLINAWISRKRVKDPQVIKQQKLFRNMYYFKTYLSNLITYIIIKQPEFTKLYIAKDLTIIEIMGWQFSFYSVPKNDTIKEYEKHYLNQKIEWSGKRLQPISPLLLHYAKMLKQEEIKSNKTDTGTS